MLLGGGDENMLSRFRLRIVVMLIGAGVPAGVLTAASAPGGTEPLSGKTLVVLDPAAPVAEVQQALAEAGFPTLEQIPQLPARYQHFRLVSGNPTEAQKNALLSVPGVLAARPLYRSLLNRDLIIPNGQVIARFHPGTPRATAEAHAASAGLKIARAFDGLPQTYVLDPVDPAADPSEVASTLANSGAVVYSQPSVLLRLEKSQAVTIDDPLYPFQWHLNNTGQLPGAVVDADIDAPEAWQITQGAGAVVAVIDDGLQTTHEDLRDNYVTGYDFENDDGDPSPSNPPSYPNPLGDYHGTAVAGIIAARANTVGVRGVAPLASLIGCKIPFGNVYATEQQIADAFLFAERNGAMVINNSWSFGGSVLPVVPTASLVLPNLVSDAITEVATNGRGGRGVLVTFAAGNASLPIPYGNVYGALPNVMTVGATLRDDLFACYSNYGAEQSVVAPGGGLGVPRGHFANLLNVVTCYEADITTTDVSETPGFDSQGEPTYPLRGMNPPMRFLNVISPFCPDLDAFFCIPLVPDQTIEDFPFHDYTRHMNGTSAACPVTSGVAALVLSVNPNLTAVQVRNLIEHTADKPTLINERFDGVTGHNVRYGHGRVNAFNAVKAAVDGKNWPSPVTNVQTISSQAFAQLFWTNPTTDVAGVLVVRSTTEFDWAPVDGITYQLGQQVAPNVVVVANDLIDRLDQTGLPTGDFHYGIFVRNAGNYYSWGRRASFGASDPNEKPLASISASPRAGSVPLTVQFAGGGVDKTGITNYFWSFGDGATATGATVSHTYNVGGTFTATLTVANGVGQTASTTTLIHVAPQDNSLPTASILATPTSGASPLVVIFQAIAQDIDGQIQEYNWNFGDGTTGSGQVVEHVYLVPGTYGVSLTVRDNAGGIGTAAQVINVTGSAPVAAATDPPGLLSPARFCGTGAASAAVVTAVGLLGVMGLRRRR